MRTELYSCRFCGCVFDIEILREIEEKKLEEQKRGEDYDSSYTYRNFSDFEHGRCPCCRKLNQW